MTDRTTSDSSSEQTDDISRRDMLQYLGGCGAVVAGVAAVGDDDDEGDEDEEKGKGKGNGNGKPEDVPPGQEENDQDNGDLNNADEARVEDAENPTADADEDTAIVEFSDQGFGKGRSANFVTADRVALNKGGYLSVHDYSRFQFAEGEDPDDYDVPEPDELERPVCESLIGITEFLEPGVYEELNVPVLEEDSPAAELAAELGNHDVEAGELEKSQPLIAIPHENNTEADDFDCPDDPEYDGDDNVDGAFVNGSKDLDVGAVNDLAVIIRGPDSEEQKELAERQVELIREGVLVPQPLV